MSRTLIFGAGWLGYKFKDYLDAELSLADITSRPAVEEELERFKPEVVISAAGKTGRPNIDWCEEHKLETLSSNVLGPLVLLQACLGRDIFLTHLSSGCIFNGQAPRSSGFTEEDEVSPPSFYSWTKAKADELLKKFPVLILRLRMPVDKKPHPRNLITKLAGYPKIIDVENSLTVVEDLLYAADELIKKRRTGIYHVVNPGRVRHREIMAWYKELVDSQHDYEIIKPEALLELGLAKAGRSNCVLDTSKLEGEGIKLPEVKERLRDYLKEYKKYL